MKIGLFILLSFITACAIIPKESLKDVDMTITPDMVRANPSSLIGRKVVWGGIILSIENMEEITLIEVFETRLSSTLRPTKETPTRSRGTHTKYGSGFPDGGGRFLISFKGYLDPVIYKVNSGITVVGFIKGVETKKIGKMDYPYPVLTPVKIYLVNLEEDEYLPLSPPWWYSPYYPYYGPYYWPYYPGYPYPPYLP